MHKIVSAVLENGLNREELLGALRNYIYYFQSFTFRLLRYDDYEDFSAFIDEIFKYLRISIKEPRTSRTSIKFIERLNHFKIFLETILRQISQREELQGEPVDEERIKAIMNQFSLQ